MDRLYFYRGVKIGSFCVIRKGKQKKRHRFFALHRHRPQTPRTHTPPHCRLPRPKPGTAPPHARSACHHTAAEPPPPRTNTRHIHLEYQTFTLPVFEAGCERARCPFRSRPEQAASTNGKGSPQTSSPRRAGSPSFPHACAPPAGKAFTPHFGLQVPNALE